MKFNKKKIFLTLFTVTFMTALASPWIIDSLFIPIIAEEINKNFAKELGYKTELKYLPEFENDLAILKPKLEFINKRRTKDAGPYLNPRTHWTVTESSQAKLDQYFSESPIQKRLLIDNNTISKLSNLSSKEIWSLPPKEFEHISTMWLQDLRQYDFWDIDKNGPNDLFKRVDLESPFPEFKTLSQAATIHLVQAKSKNKSEKIKAMQNVLHLGELIMTTETLIGEMIFISLIKKVKSYQESIPELKESLGPWEAIIKDSDRLQRVYWGIIQFTNPFHMKEKHTKKMHLFFKETSLVVGLCGAVRETLQAATSQ